MKDLVVTVKDRVGLLADLSFVLAKNKINIESVDVDVINENAIITLSLSDNDRGKIILEKSGYVVDESDIIKIKLLDKPGELNKVADLLSKESVNIKTMHIISKENNYTILAIRVNNQKKALEILKKFLI